jgi:hypothetical protein
MVVGSASAVANIPGRTSSTIEKAMGIGHAVGLMIVTTMIRGGRHHVGAMIEKWTIT